MNKKEFKEELLGLIDKEVGDLSFDEKLKLVRDYVFQIEKDKEYSQINKRKEWTDEELKIVFSLSPNRENCLKLAKAFNRGYGSIEEIYRWAITCDKNIEASTHSNNVFIRQIKRVAKESGWRV